MAQDPEDCVEKLQGSSKVTTQIQVTVHGKVWQWLSKEEREGDKAQSELP